MAQLKQLQRRPRTSTGFEPMTSAILVRCSRPRASAIYTHYMKSEMMSIRYRLVLPNQSDTVFYSLHFAWSVTSRMTFGWSPDIKECETGIAQCDKNAKCVNVPGSYLCTCKVGYTGDGKACSGDKIFDELTDRQKDRQTNNQAIKSQSKRGHETLNQNDVF